MLLLRGTTIDIRIHHLHKKLYITVFLLSMFGPDYYVSAKWIMRHTRVPADDIRRAIQDRGYCITGNHSKQDQTLLVKIAKYIGFCAYRRSYSIWFPLIVDLPSFFLNLDNTVRIDDLSGLRNCFHYTVELLVQGLTHPKPWSGCRSKRSSKFMFRVDIL